MPADPVELEFPVKSFRQKFCNKINCKRTYPVDIEITADPVDHKIHAKSILKVSTKNDLNRICPVDLKIPNF